MAKDSSIQAQGIRERHLNIVYFVDSSKSHSIRLNFALARWIVAGAIGLIAWSVISIGWIIGLGSTLEGTREHLTSALTAVFNYQVKYDHVFETAYPENMTQSYYASGGQLAANDPILPSSPSRGSIPSELKATNKTDSKLDAGLTGAADKAKPPIAKVDADVDGSIASVETSTSTKNLTMDIKNSALSASKGKMMLLFDITNKDPLRKAEGYIWATATLSLADGSLMRVAAPSHSKINSAGDVDAYTTTYKFSIQRFKKKDFTFSVPEDETWKVKDLKITYVDPHGKQQYSETINTPLKFVSPSSIEAEIESPTTNAGDSAEP